MRIPYRALYSDLLEDLSDSVPSFRAIISGGVQEADYWPGMTRQEFASLAMAKSFFKKLEDRTNAAADDTALDKFLTSNLSCKEWSLRIENLEDELLVGLFKQEIYRFFNPTGLTPLWSTHQEILQSLDTGPGAAIGANGNDFYTKLFSSPLTSSSETLDWLYQDYLKYLPDWSQGETLRQATFGPVKIVEGNRLCFVPKNEDTSRVICVEPSLNMVFQKGLQMILERRLRRFFGIDLTYQQDINRDLARLGSITGTLATVDLSSASDSISRKMVKEMFPRDIFAWLDILRSPSVILPDGRSEELHMLSSMGNAYTFPLETIIFSCVVSAVYQARETELIRSLPDKGRRRIGISRLGNFGVFGDDIIIEKDALRQVERLLKLLGFTINAEKSFSEGPFRESCGGDYFDGSPVRGVYIKSLRTPADRYVAINRLNEWSAIHSIPLRRTVERLCRMVRFLPVPLYENLDAGIRVPHSYLSFVSRKGGALPKGGIIYRRWESVPKRLRISEGAVSSPKGAKKRIYNPHGLLTAALRGDVRNCTIGIRLGPARYRAKQGVSPNWDWYPTVGCNNPIDQGRLVTAIWTNLMFVHAPR